MIIENQLTITDHSHLGQLLTYAAGLKASIVVWIAERFTEQHKATLDWLNNNTRDDLNFFGLEIELFKIGKSLPAPKFNVIVQPKDWHKFVTKNLKNTNVTEMKKTQLDYWTEFSQILKNEKFLHSRKPQTENYMNFPIGKSNVSISTKVFSEEKSISVELYLSGKNAKKNFNTLLSKKENIEKTFNKKFNWDEHPENGPNKIFIKSFDADLSNKNDWKKQHEWLKQTLFEFHSIFVPLCKYLS